MAIPSADTTIDLGTCLILNHEAINRTCLHKRIRRLLQQKLVDFMLDVHVKGKLIIERARFTCHPGGDSVRMDSGLVLDPTEFTAQMGASWRVEALILCLLTPVPVPLRAFLQINLFPLFRENREPFRAVFTLRLLVIEGYLFHPHKPRISHYQCSVRELQDSLLWGAVQTLPVNSTWLVMVGLEFLYFSTESLKHYTIYFSLD